MSYLLGLTNIVTSSAYKEALMSLDLGETWCRTGVHRQNEKHGGDGIPLPKAPLVLYRSSRYAV
jgi:hypothetical protein